MIPRLTKRTLFAALFALAAVLAAIGAAVAPAGVARGQEEPAVSIDGLVGELEKGSSDSFRVNATGLDTSKTYWIRIRASSAYQAGGSQGNVIPSNVGFNSTCLDIKEDESVSGVSSTSVGRTLHACSTPGGTVTAFLYEGETSLLDHVFQTVAVKDDDPEPTPAPKAPAPQSFTVTRSFQNSVRLSWSAVTGATEYKLEWSGSSKTGSSKTSGTSYTVTNLVCNIEYTFKVSAKGDGATYSTAFGSAASVSGTTSTCPAAPAPSGFKATGSTQSTVTLAWTAVTDAEEYKLERRVGSDNWTTVDSAIPGATISYNVHSLVSCTNYQFRIRAKGGGSPYSTSFGSAADVSEMTTGCVSNPQPTATPTPRPVTLRPPTNLSASVNSTDDDKIDVTYTRSESPHYYKFEIRKSKSRNRSYSSEETRNDARSPVSFNGLDQGYWYKARGRNCENSARTRCGSWGGYSDPLFLFPTLTAPSSLTLGAGGDSISVRFATPSLSTNLLDYKLALMSIRDKTAPTQDAYSQVASAIVAASTSSGSLTFRSLGANSGDLYKVRLSACLNSSSCETVESSTLRRPLPPTGLALSLSPADSANIKVAYSVRANATTHNYKTELHTATSEMGIYSQTGSTLNSGRTTRPTFANQTRDKWYKARTKNCLNAARTQCGLWSAWSSAFRIKPKLAKPTGLDIMPMPLRKARLTWTASSNADSNTEYEVQFATQSNPTQWLSLASKVANSAIADGHVIELDDVINSKGFAQEDYFNIRIVAEDKAKTNAKLTSEPSEVVRIADTPIESVNGDSTDSQSSSTGKAVIKWTPPAGVTEVAVRHRKLGDNSAGHPHTHHMWTLDGSLPDSYVEKTIRFPNIGQRITLTDHLTLEEVYALHFNYKAGGVWTYAARDAYVWPSKRAAGGGEYVASFPLNHPISHETYSYKICLGTFPDIDRNDDDENDWETLIKHALEQWETASERLVVMTHLGNACADYSGFIPLIEDAIDPEDGEKDEVVDLIRDFLEMASGYGITQRNDRLGNDVRMLDDTDRFIKILLDNGVLNEIGVGYDCPHLGALVGCAPLDQYATERGRVVVTTDILLRRTAVDPGTINPNDLVGPIGNNKDFPNVDGIDLQLRMPSGSVRLSMCPRLYNPDYNSRNSNNHHIRIEWEAYDTLVHEAGHALGIRAGRMGTQHPNTRDSLMNSKNTDELAILYCSPTPLDLLAIYTLYQTAD